MKSEKKIRAISEVNVLLCVMAMELYEYSEQSLCKVLCMSRFFSAVHLDPISILREDIRFQ